MRKRDVAALTNSNDLFHNTVLLLIKTTLCPSLADGLFLRPVDSQLTWYSIYL